MADGWIKTPRGWRKAYSARVGASVAASTFPCPQIRSDSIDPVRSMADGRLHDSKASLMRSYRADGNPQGVEYQVVGNDQRPTETKAGNVPDAATRQKSRITSIHRAEAAIARGDGVPLPT